MEIIEKRMDFQLQGNTAVAFGKFDGVHIGHRKLLAEILAKKAEGMQTCVFTFDPPPAVLFGVSDGKELSTKEEKRQLFQEMGIDILIEFPLTNETAGISGESFVRDFLCRKMCARFIAAGEDLSFGRGGKGDAKLLQGMSAELGYALCLIEKIRLDGVEISSTVIRDLVEKGAMENAARMLGAPYSVSGTVVHGNRIGRTLGFPTVNLLPPGDKLMPPNGVYVSRVLFDGEEHSALSNVGYKPTVTDDKVLGLESYLYDFDRDIYGRSIEVELLAFRRPERKFAGIGELKAQLQKDIAAGQCDRH